jgi:hypothetical protein
LKNAHSCQFGSFHLKNLCEESRCSHGGLTDPVERKMQTIPSVTPLLEASRLSALNLITGTFHSAFKACAARGLFGRAAFGGRVLYGGHLGARMREEAEIVLDTAIVSNVVVAR